jgi:hypothetical protein
MQAAAVGRRPYYYYSLMESWIQIYNMNLNNCVPGLFGALIELLYVAGKSSAHLPVEASGATGYTGKIVSY